MTKLSRYSDMYEEGYLYSIYTCDSWEIPEEGTEIWCTGWKHGQTIKPYGDGCHVVVGFTSYHCDELMDILSNWERGGYTWGIEGVVMKRRQQINGNWRWVSI